ncbi:class F sortase [Streptomyces polyrhachis]|uniref:Class F sortase n=1 Tax=Streptomyces polyrhachis TaxID=1282885 RepID=A0ABW2GHZ7_9ACTN
MSAGVGWSGRRTKVLVWAVLLACLWLWGRTHGPAVAGAQGAVSRVRTLQGPAPKAAAPLRGSDPVSLYVPGAGVEAPVIERGLDGAGAVEAPPFASPQEVGWYRGGARPGAAGVATFVGHLDTGSSAAVFYRLAEVRPGQRLRVVRADGSTAEFTVDRVETVERRHFDAERVYGPHVKGRAEVRLITCGGRYLPEEKSYTANLVVSGYLTASR